MIDRSEARRVNLVRVLRELEWDGAIGMRVKAEVLGTAEADIQEVLAGRAMTDLLARDIEWAAQKPALWMDEDHSLEPLA
jgi:hypothetical protein